VKRDAPDGQRPDLYLHGASANLHTHEQRRPLVIERVLERQMRKVLVQADRLLPAFLVDLLTEVALLVEECDGDKVDVQIARALAMISRENAEAAGIVRHGFMEAELRAEIGHRSRRQRALLVSLAVSVLAREIRLELRVHRSHLAQKIIILRDLVKPRLLAEL